MNKYPLIVVISLLAFFLCQACTKQGDASSASKPQGQSNVQTESTPIPEKPVSIAEALTGEHRTPENRARDIYRHPLETLAFFELSPEHTVVEIWPGRGWYTEILAPVLRANGKLYAAGFSTRLRSRFYRGMIQELDEKYQADPQVYDRVTVTTLNPPNEIDIAPEASADRVFTFRNVQIPSAFKNTPFIVRIFSHTHCYKSLK